MRALLTNHCLHHVGGTEKWVWTVARELLLSGWDVDAFCFIRGDAADRLEAEGVHVSTQVPQGQAYDLVLVNHNTCLHAVREAGVQGPKVYTSHGPHNRMEQPSSGADYYVAVSPEVAAHCHDLGHAAVVITNGLDLEEFQPDGPPASPLRVLSMCKEPLACNMVATACTRLGLPFEGLHYTLKPEWDAAPVVRRNDVVVGCGRSALEGLACGKRVLVFDARANREPRGDGWVTEANVDVLAARNLACRTVNAPMSITQIADALANPPADVEWERPWAEAHCNVFDKVDQYLQLVGIA